ncbi:MAG TPA: alcohol dehydrogenase catalytic domain-containing protein [Candidatus Limnocylindrales bacterium]|nr:alcohol dehydrogenase catalytic domain-containing protein [Candidatus Limnocylindrales bacterium]
MMRALVLKDGLRFQPEAASPESGGDQVLVRIARAGICNTDLELRAGYMGFEGIPGHEFVGIAETGLWAGKRVVGEINVADGTCDLCLRGMRTQCRHRTTVGMSGHDGAFADYLALAAANLHEVPDGVSDDEAVFTEPLAAALQVLEAIHLSPRDRVVVIGAGKLGLLVAQVLALTGANLTVIARRERPRQLLERWRIPAVNAADLEDQRAQVIVDCTGTAEGFQLAQRLVEPRGTIVLKSTYTMVPSANLTRVAVDEVHVVGSRCGPFEAALRLLARRSVDVASMIDARYPIEQGMEAFARAAEPGALKVLLTF